MSDDNDAWEAAEAREMLGDQVEELRKDRADLLVAAEHLWLCGDSGCPDCVAADRTIRRIKASVAAGR